MGFLLLTFGQQQKRKKWFFLFLRKIFLEKFFFCLLAFCLNFLFLFACKMNFSQSSRQRDCCFWEGRLKEEGQVSHNETRASYKNLFFLFFSTGFFLTSHIVAEFYNFLFFFGWNSHTKMQKKQISCRNLEVFLGERSTLPFFFFSGRGEILQICFSFFSSFFRDFHSCKLVSLFFSFFIVL